MLRCTVEARRISREGFTLVELLIVIVVIGVLSAMMMLSSTEAVSSARATDIISNLRQWKTATLAWYMDHIEEAESHNAGGKTVYTNFADYVKPSDITPYFGIELEKATQHDVKYGGGHVKDGSGLIYFTDHNTNIGKVWLIGCEFPNDDRIKEKLEARAASTGLIDKSGNVYKKNSDHVVFIKVADFD